jgi:hypothetical protein
LPAGCVAIAIAIAIAQRSLNRCGSFERPSRTQQTHRFLHRGQEIFVHLHHRVPYVG